MKTSFFSTSTTSTTIGPWIRGGGFARSAGACVAGASGAIFGVLGATFVIARGRRLDAVAGQIGILILINLVFTFSDGSISVGAHVGGLAAGVLCGFLIIGGERGKLGRENHLAVELVAMAAIGVLSFVLALAVA